LKSYHTENPSLKGPWQICLIGLLLIFFFSGFLLRSDGGINLDTILYVQNAEHLPALSTNIFPLGYSVGLKTFQLFLNDYFWSSKVLNLFCVVFILGFSWSRKFYFTETLVLLCLKVGIGLWSFSFSEPLFLSILYYQFYLLHQHFENQTQDRFWPIKLSLAMLALLLVRHTGIFIFFGYGTFLAFLFWKRRKVIFKENYFRFILISGFLTILYLGWNWFFFHSFFGENHRGAPDIFSNEAYWRHLFLNFKGAISAWNPLYSIVLQHNDNPAYWPIEWGIFLLDVSIAIGFCLFFIRQFKILSAFNQLLLWLGFAYLGLLFFSSLQAGIEILNNRLLASVSFCFFFPFLIIFLKIYPEKKPFLFKIALFSLVFNFVFLVKNPSNYLAIRANTIHFLETHPNAKFFFIDKDETPETVYRLPFIRKEFRYKHDVLKPSYINRHSLFILKPDLIEIEKLEPEMKKQEVILNSEVQN
jgi:hypothetical protein